MVVVPPGYVSVKGLPSLRVPVIVGWLSQLSVAVAAPGTTCAAQVPGSVPVVILAGQLIVGGVVSLTVNVVVHELLFPEPSVAVRVIVCGPCPTMVPGAGLWVTVTAPQLSEVVAPDLTSGTGA